MQILSWRRLQMENAKKIEFLQKFFSYSIDDEMNKLILMGRAFDIKKEAESYLNNILEIPLDEFVSFIMQHIPREYILAADTFQFSDFEDATINVCNVIDTLGNNGVAFKEIGIKLLNDQGKRKDLALRKYGENHLKAAMLLGLVFKGDNRLYYLSAVGGVFKEATKDYREKLLCRLVIRNKLIRQIISKASQGEFELETFLYDLSESTYIRRKPNIKYVLEILRGCDEYDFTNILDNISY